MTDTLNMFDKLKCHLGGHDRAQVMGPPPWLWLTILVTLVISIILVNI